MQRGRGEEAGSHLKQRRLGKKKKRTDLPKRRKRNEQIRKQGGRN
jgi:hypothetical protein